jgi:DNA-binding GntR family transcriptional regulator
MSLMVKTTLAEQAYQELRSRIVTGRLAGGMRLFPNELALDLGISPTPVKEACTRLEADGLVISSTRRGLVVRRLTEVDVEELYNGRLLLETGAIERAFAQDGITDALLSDLRDALTQHRQHANAVSLDGLSKALFFDRSFHAHLVAAAGISMVCDWHARILGQTHTVLVSVPGNYDRSVADHQQIFDAIAARDQGQTIEAMKLHLEHSRVNTLVLVKRLEARSDKAE